MKQQPKRASPRSSQEGDEKTVNGRGVIFMRSVMSCEASSLLLRTPARETLLSTVLSVYSPPTGFVAASSRFVQAGGVREGGRRILRRPSQPNSARDDLRNPSKRRIEGRSAAARCVGEQLCPRQRWARGAKVSSRGARKEAKQRMKR